MEIFQKGALSQTQAQERALLFSPNHDSLHYDLFLKLMKGETFEGNVTATFDLQKDKSEGLFFDYAGAYVQQITVNGNLLPAENGNYDSYRDRRFIRIPSTHLKQGRNQINIVYSNVYANDGQGLHSFYDTDGKQYLYSQGEIYEINKVFPCFDQPDLKATLSVTIAVPNDWISIANQPVSTEPSLNMDKYLAQEDQKLYKITTYSKTPRLSSYLFAFIAGPYREIKCESLHRNIPMSCYSRESLFPYLKEQAEEVFEVTRETLSFYERFFNTPYPFAKYDTIFGPEFFFFAMENAGAVVFDDRYIWREKVSLDKSIMRHVLIAHEAAHHWFGDLVTMNWWNDIWLNESFAEFISYFCLHNIKPMVKIANLECSWVKFFEETDWGYSDDQKRTTHPIAGEVRDTTEAVGVFDGITYSKGAASLKQIMHLIGEENFGQAMYQYFKKFAWMNTTLDDFIANLQEFYKPTHKGSPANLEEWKNEWLMTAGVNECLPLFNPEDQSLEAKLVIRQTSALKDFPTLRHHKMKIAFFDDEAKVYEEKDLVLNNTPETVISYDGTKRPRAVLLNYKNESYIKVRLDPHSISFLKRKAASIPDELTKIIFWKSLFDMVRDGQVSAGSFIEAATSTIELEKSDWILNSILRFASSVCKYSPKILNRNVLKSQLFDRVLKTLVTTCKNNEDERTIVLRQSLIKFATYGEEKGVDNLKILKEWIDGTHKELGKFELDVQNKWDIVIALHKYPKLENNMKTSYFNKVAELDSSDRMRLMEKRCEAMRAQGNERDKLEQSFLDPNNKDSAYLLEQSMKGFSTSIWSVKEDEEKFFDNLLKVFSLKTEEAGKNFYKAFFPKRENLSYYVKRIEDLLKEGVENEFFQKLLVNSLDDLERKKKGYACCGADLMRAFLDISL